MTDALQTLLLVAILGFLVMQRKPSVLFGAKQRKLVIDTCALIDGRIVELVDSGFIQDTLIVPEFVLHELQMLADGADAHKRERARFGLDVVKELQDSANTTVVIDHTEHARQPNDDKLIALAQHLKSPLYTTDYNLSKLAEIKSVKVLNVNELAQNLRPVAIPGEHKNIKILQKGSNARQGVGYLEDGTMVVVDGAARLVGKTLEVEVTRTHQTVAGKMLFGVPVGSLPSEPPTTTQPTQAKLAARLRKNLRPSKI